MVEIASQNAVVDRVGALCSEQLDWVHLGAPNLIHTSLLAPQSNVSFRRRRAGLTDKLRAAGLERARHSWRTIEIVRL